MVLVNLQKVFDTVDDKILISKLSAIGFDLGCLSWFQSYLEGRKQVVDISDICSSHSTISCGVPHGSLLGPLLFTSYVNDMSAAANCHLLMYSDDSALIVSGRDRKELETRSLVF